MFGPPNRNRPATTTTTNGKMTSQVTIVKPRSATGGSLSNVRKPVTCPTVGRLKPAAGMGGKSAASSSSSDDPRSTRAADQSGSLVGSAAKSASRSSVQSDTSNSVCSSSLTSSLTSNVQPADTCALASESATTTTTTTTTQPDPEAPKASKGCAASSEVSVNNRASEAKGKSAAAAAAATAATSLARTNSSVSSKSTPGSTATSSKARSGSSVSVAGFGSATTRFPASASNGFAARLACAPMSKQQASITTSITSITASSNGAHVSTSSSSARHRVPTLAMSLRDKDQQIKLLIKERDEQKFQAELMAKRAQEWQEKFVQSEVEKSHVTSEADDEVVELRRLAQEFEDENRKLAQKLSSYEQLIGDTQFKLDEIECERCELIKTLKDKEDQIGKIMEAEAERERERERERESQFQLDAKAKPTTIEQQIDAQVVAGGQQLANSAQLLGSPGKTPSERAISKHKYEREIEELKEKVTSKEEQMIQLRSSLEMRKNELANVQARSSDLERKLKLESERSERHLKRIDEINLELKACEAKLQIKSEENQMLDKQVRQLRQQLRAQEDKLEQLSLARKKDVDILHNKLAVARRGGGGAGSAGGGGGGSSSVPTSPQPYPKTPTPQDELIRLQMEIRDLKDQLIDREAELDCNRRDIDVMRHKMETRTLDVDCNNQELARRCQDLLEQNRQSEDTVKQLLKSNTEHSAQLLRATEDLKEANCKCLQLRDEINLLETKLDQQIQQNMSLTKQNNQLKDDTDEYIAQIKLLRNQVETLNGQLGELCEQLDVQTDCLHKDREALADQLSQKEIEFAQIQHDLATSKQDLRTNKLATQEVVSERDRLKADLLIKDKYIASRNDIIETLRSELDDSRKSVADLKLKLETLRQSMLNESDKLGHELKAQLDSLKADYRIKCDENSSLKSKYEKLFKELQDLSSIRELDEMKQFDDMRRKHSTELDVLRLKIQDLQNQLDEAHSSTLKRNDTANTIGAKSQISGSQSSNISLASSKYELHDSKQLVSSSSTTNLTPDKPTPTVQFNPNNNTKQQQQQEDYEIQIDFLNSLVVDMQRKCDDYKNRLAQIETVNIMDEFDNLIQSNQPSSRPPKEAPKESKLAAAAAAAANADSANTLTRTPKPHPTNGVGEGVSGAGSGSGSAGQQLAIKPSCRISGRPYCDICNVFDLHHTIYCPKVSEKLATRELDNLINNNDDNINNNNNVSNNNISNQTNNNTNTNTNTNSNSNNNIANNLKNICHTSMDDVDAMFRDYEQSIHISALQEYSSLRRSQTMKPSRPYCDHCDLYGHNMKGCNKMRVQKV